MIEFLQYSFMKNALLVGLLASVACGLVGTFVVVKRIVFISGGISHTAFGGIGLGYYLNINPVIGAFIFSVASAFGISIISKRTKRTDTAIGIMWAVGMAIGLIFISIKEGYAPDLFSYLFGNILTVSNFDLIMILVLDVIVVLVITIFFKELTAISFDEEYAEASGVPVGFISLILYILIAITVIILIRIVGIILVIALLTIPSATANIFIRDIKRLLVFSVVFGVIFTVSGLIISYYLDLPSGATIILVCGIVFVITSLISNLFRKKKPEHIG
jgi:zinc transport system permease protein